jgi:DNA-binding CsgD family transcriptional regulator
VNIPSARVQQLLRLLGEGYELSSDPEKQQLHLLQGLIDLVGCVAVQRLQAHDYAPGRGFRLGHCLDLGLDLGDRYQRRLAGGQAPAEGDPFSPVFIARYSDTPAHAVSAALRAETVDNRAWYNSPYVADLRRPARIDETIITARVAGPKHADALTIVRAWGDPPFSEEDRDVIRLFHAEVLGRFPVPDGSPSPLPPSLQGAWSPRERATLALLLTSASEKQVAANIGISPHTAHDYVKAIYRKLRVRSRAELMALAVRSKQGRH